MENIPLFGSYKKVIHSVVRCPYIYTIRSPIMFHFIHGTKIGWFVYQINFIWPE